MSFLPMTVFTPFQTSTLEFIENKSISNLGVKEVVGLSAYNILFNTIS